MSASPLMLSFCPKVKKTQLLADAQLLTSLPVHIVCWYAYWLEKGPDYLLVQ
jgi:hypothetical protein